ncbi:MAG: HisA/HisF-related TIM barrel protein [Planctomycetota bacterium]
MLTARIIPCLDVRDGRIVKGVQFQGLRDAGDPVARAALYQEQGADEIVVLDVAATPDRRAHQRDTIRALRRVLSIPMTVGGGVRGIDDAEALLEAGADKVAINTAAVADPDIVDQLVARFGAQCIVLAIDAARRTDGWEVLVCSGRERTGRDAVTWAGATPAGEILLTSFDRDGTQEGYDTDLLRAVRANTSVPLVASGGAGSIDHLASGLAAGADAVLLASLLHDGQTDIQTIKRALRDQGVEVRR